MSPAPLTRRALVAAAGAALGAAALPAGITRALAAETAPAGVPGAVPAVFDAAAYVADLKAIGCRPYGFRAVSIDDGTIGPWRYGIEAPECRDFGEDFRLVMARWSDAIEACPDHDLVVGAYIAGLGR